MFRIFLYVIFSSLFAGCAEMPQQTTMPINKNFYDDPNLNNAIFNNTGPPQLEDKNGYFMLPPVTLPLN